MGRPERAAGTPNHPLPKEPIQPCHLLTWKRGVLTGEAERATSCSPGSTARCCRRMQRVSQGQKALSTGPLRMGSQSQKGAGLGWEEPKCQGHGQSRRRPFHRARPRGSSHCFVPIPCPAEGTAHYLMSLCSSPTRKPKHHQASSQARNQVAISTEPAVRQGAPDRECVHMGGSPSPERRPPCLNLTWQRERFPDLPPPLLPKHSPQGWGADSRFTPKFPGKNKEEISAAGQQQGLKLERRKNFPMPKEPAAKEWHGFLPSQALCPREQRGPWVGEAVEEPTPVASWPPAQGIDSSGKNRALPGTGSRAAKMEVGARQGLRTRSDFELDPKSSCEQDPNSNLGPRPHSAFRPDLSSDCEPEQNTQASISKPVRKCRPFSQGATRHPGCWSLGEPPSRQQGGRVMRLSLEWGRGESTCNAVAVAVAVAGLGTVTGVLAG